MEQDELEKIRREIALSQAILGDAESAKVPKYFELVDNATRGSAGLYPSYAALPEDQGAMRRDADPQLQAWRKEFLEHRDLKSIEDKSQHRKVLEAAYKSLKDAFIHSNPSAKPRINMSFGDLAGLLGGPVEPMAANVEELTRGDSEELKTQLGQTVFHHESGKTKVEPTRVHVPGRMTDAFKDHVTELSPDQGLLYPMAQFVDDGDQVTSLDKDIDSSQRHTEAFQSHQETEVYSGPGSDWSIDSEGADLRGPVTKFMDDSKNKTALYPDNDEYKPTAKFGKKTAFYAPPPPPMNRDFVSEFMSERGGADAYLDDDLDDAKFGNAGNSFVDNAEPDEPYNPGFNERIDNMIHNIRTSSQWGGRRNRDPMGDGGDLFGESSRSEKETNDMLISVLKALTDKIDKLTHVMEVGSPAGMNKVRSDEKKGKKKDKKMSNDTTTSANEVHSTGHAHIARVFARDTVLGR